MPVNNQRETRLAALDEALQVIENIRYRTACTFTPECSGQRGEDKCNILHEAYHAVLALKTQEPKNDAA